MTLVGYGSSDEEDVNDDSLNVKVPDESTIHSANGAKNDDHTNGKPTPPSQTEPKLDGPFVGPTFGPTGDIPEEMRLEEDQALPPQSPYSANQALLRDLTLPTIPNYDIPPSPPGSPRESTNAKFKHFLELKKQGIHFNEKLSKSSAVKNPSLMQKLMEFADIEEAGQYSTTLPKEFWDPTLFPQSVYKEELAKSQQTILKRREVEKTRGQRESVDFVPATTTQESSSRSGTPGTGARPTQKSAAERVMAGLEKGRSNSPQVQGVKRKSRFDS